MCWRRTDQRSNGDAHFFIDLIDGLGYGLLTSPHD